ncbi:MAG: hypothetical protein WBN29_00945 [Polyangiales bacterium]|jgi:hypothetical protein
MSSLARISVISLFIVELASACASGRVRGAQGTEMGQAEAYEPQQKVEPPTGNVDKTSGPLTPIDTYPLLEVDLERRRPAVGPGPEPEPQAGPQPEPKPEPGNAPE